MILLDASAVLAFLRDEPGADLVHDVLEGGGAILSSVTWAELVFKARRLAMAVPGDLLLLVDVHPFSLDHANASTDFTLPGLSLGDRCCLAVARALDVPVLTADRLWAAVDSVDVRLIRS